MISFVRISFSTSHLGSGGGGEEEVQLDSMLFRNEAKMRFMNFGFRSVPVNERDSACYIVGVTVTFQTAKELRS